MRDLLDIDADLIGRYDTAGPRYTSYPTAAQFHGGFDAAGTYRSPRTRFRVPAIAAWQAKHRADFGTELLDAGVDTWPPATPNVAPSIARLSTIPASRQSVSISKLAAGRQETSRSPRMHATSRRSRSRRRGGASMPSAH